MRVIEIDNTDELPKIRMWNSVATINVAIAEVTKRTGAEVEVVYKLKGHRQFFIPYPAPSVTEEKS